MAAWALPCVAQTKRPSPFHCGATSQPAEKRKCKTFCAHRRAREHELWGRKTRHKHRKTKRESFIARRLRCVAFAQPLRSSWFLFLFFCFFFFCSLLTPVRSSCAGIEMSVSESQSENRLGAAWQFQFTEKACQSPLCLPLYPFHFPSRLKVGPVGKCLMQRMPPDAAVVTPSRKRRWQTTFYPQPAARGPPMAGNRKCLERLRRYLMPTGGREKGKRTTRQKKGQIRSYDPGTIVLDHKTGTTAREGRL